MSENLSLEQLQQEAIAFRAAQDAVILATTAADGTPDASYAPCVLDDDGRCHLLISQLARHTKNLLERPAASLLWIEERAAAGNPFARRRLVLRCTAVHIDRDSGSWHGMVARMEAALGNTVPLIAGLGDFMLFRFDALDGDYVRGFARAYPVSGNGLAMAERRTR
jgi:putative heme iron utilization protein